MGLDPNKAYYFDSSREAEKNAFHLYKVPDDFMVVKSFIGHDKLFYKMNIVGNGVVKV